MADHIRRRRLELRLNQKEAAAQLGVKSWTVLNWEKGRTRPPIASMAAILRWLGYNPFPEPKTLRERMLAARRAHGWTIVEAAEKFGVDPSTWGRWERSSLASISGGVTASFGYDGAGRRRTKTIGGVQTGFLYDGFNFVQELSGGAATANLITGDIDEVFQRKTSLSARYFMTDALGSAIALADTSGVQTQYSFEPYGNTTLSGSPDANSQSYTGREDDGTGLFYYRARYYRAPAGRFISEDPIGILGGSNAYRYVDASPTNFVDPLGLVGAGTAIGIGGAIAACGVVFSYYTSKKASNQALQQYHAVADSCFKHQNLQACGHLQWYEEQWLKTTPEFLKDSTDLKNLDQRSPIGKGLRDLRDAQR